MPQQLRPPVVTIMGHVDHGKTTLLDYLRKTNVQAGEDGGITQHIGAYQVSYKQKKITFIDTPGHAAFTKMRQRGAMITDIVILVVAADDGVKPQTLESIRHIKESKTALIVAINKIDLKTAQPDVVKGELAQHGLLVSDLGGDVEVVEISAKTGKGVDHLLATIVAMGELMELTADPQAPLKAVVIESSLDESKGPLASVIVMEGSLKMRQQLSIQNKKIIGRVKSLRDAIGQQYPAVLPGCPTEIQGLNDVPTVGMVLLDANAVYGEIKQIDQTKIQVEKQNPFADWNFDTALAEEIKPKLNLIIKSDVWGTLEAIVQTIDQDSVTVISQGVGVVSESDVELALTTHALILAFRTKVPSQIKKLAKQNKVKIKEYDIIYQLIEDLQKQMLKLIEPRIGEVETGQAEILEIFNMKGNQVAGCKVITGEIKKTDLLHLIRGDEVVASPQIASMQHGKTETDKVTAKSECGIIFKNKKLIFQKGDKLVAYYEEE